ncbi:glycine zipper domain-containing protein [Sphingomonas tabacisoli]|uniref:Glycine zipper domain-containing protein n=1 Tax=Sphingomonas tabacisoli TaxID=2249466 RepID=A0ABW4I2F4_9SPHN
MNMKKLMVAASIATALAPVAVSPADARYYRARHSYHRGCVRGHGTTGLLVGGATGALVGSAVTHGAAGPIIGAAGGALLGRHIQRHRRC